MKKMLMILAALAFATSAMAADLEEDGTRAIKPLRVLAPGDSFTQFSPLLTPWPAEIDSWPILCLGTGTLNISVSDYYDSGNVIFGLSWKFGSTSVTPNLCTTGCTFSITEQVLNPTFFIVFVGYAPESIPRGYDIRVSFSP